jgi:hypothetical protein
VKILKAYYLKINNGDRINLNIFWHWVKIVEAAGADYFILADREDVKTRLVQLYVEKGYPEPVNFIASKREELRDLCEGLYSEYWLNVAYAHLTPFLHAKENNYSGFWGIDADDTVLCASPAHCAQLLHEAEQYAINNALNLFSLDMWYSRVSIYGFYHWTFGVVFTNMNADYPEILEKGKLLLGGKAIAEMPKMVHHPSIDNYFSFLSHSGQLRCQSFYGECFIFEHFKHYVIMYENGRIKYIKDTFGAATGHPIAGDVVKLGLTPTAMQSSLEIWGEIHERSETEISKFYDEKAVCWTTSVDEEKLKGRANIVLFGAGADGRRALVACRLAEIPVRWFCDSNPQLWGVNIDGVDVISPQELKDKRDAAVIITSGQYRNEIEAQLAEMGITALNAQTQ